MATMAGLQVGAHVRATVDGASFFCPVVRASGRFVWLSLESYGMGEVRVSLDTGRGRFNWQGRRYVLVIPA